MVRIKFPRIEFISGIALLSFSLCGCDADTDPANTDASVRAVGGEHVDAAYRQGAGDAATTAPARPVVSQLMAYTEHKDELIYGYFSAPADMFEPLPAIILIHEWWGLNDNIRAMADRLAGEGYIVFALDLFQGAAASTPSEGRKLMMEIVEEPLPARKNIRAAIGFVSTTAGAPRIGSIGWGFGGGWSLSAAQFFPEELDAVVIYYGQVSADEDLLRPISAPILGLFADQDKGIKAASVEAFRSALGRLRKNYEVHIYPGVGHGFANPDSRHYDEQAANDAWRRTLKFMDLHLLTHVSN